MTATAPATPKTKQTTEYVILERAVSDHSWKERGTYPARSAAEAIRAHSKNGGASSPVGDGATFVAVPAKSFKPVKVTVKTETKITLG